MIKQQYALKLGPLDPFLWGRNLKGPGTNCPAVNVLHYKEQIFNHMYEWVLSLTNEEVFPGWEGALVWFYPSQTPPAASLHCCFRMTPPAASNKSGSWRWGESREKPASPSLEYSAVLYKLHKWMRERSLERQLQLYWLLQVVLNSTTFTKGGYILSLQSKCTCKIHLWQVSPCFVKDLSMSPPLEPVDFQLSLPCFPLEKRQVWIPYIGQQNSLQVKKKLLRLTLSSVYVHIKCSDLPWMCPMWCKIFGLAQYQHGTRCPAVVQDSGQGWPKVMLPPPMVGPLNCAYIKRVILTWS